MGPKCYAVQCIVDGKETPKTAPSPWDSITLQGKDRATVIRNIHKNLVKIARVVAEIFSQTDRQTGTDTYIHTLFVTILRKNCKQKTEPGLNRELRGVVLGTG